MKVQVELPDVKELSLQNIPNSPVVLTDGEITETKDVVKVIFAGFEAYKKANEDGVINTEDLLKLGKLGLLVPSAFIGGSSIMPEITETTALKVVADVPVLADEFELGEYRNTAINAVFTIIFGTKTVIGGNV